MKFFVQSKYGFNPLNMEELAPELFDLIMADQVREFTVYGPDMVTPVGKWYLGAWYPDTNFAMEVAGVDK